MLDVFAGMIKKADGTFDLTDEVKQLCKLQIQLNRKNKYNS